MIMSDTIALEFIVCLLLLTLDWISFCKLAFHYLTESYVCYCFWKIWFYDNIDWISCMDTQKTVLPDINKLVPLHANRLPCKWLYMVKESVAAYDVAYSYTTKMMSFALVVSTYLLLSYIHKCNCSYLCSVISWLCWV